MQSSIFPLVVPPVARQAIGSGGTGCHINPDNDDIEFGSKFLFEPELGVGAKLSDRLSIEASLVHMSHGQLFSEQNSGIHNLGVRLTWELP